MKPVYVFFLLISIVSPSCTYGSTFLPLGQIDRSGVSRASISFHDNDLFTVNSSFFSQLECVPRHRVVLASSCPGCVVVHWDLESIGKISLDVSDQWAERGAAACRRMKMDLRTSFTLFVAQSASMWLRCGSRFKRHDIHCTRVSFQLADPRSNSIG